MGKKASEVFVRTRKPGAHGKMTFVDLSDEQKVELKRKILKSRAEDRGEEASPEELKNADDLVSDGDLKDWFRTAELREVHFDGTEDKPVELVVCAKCMDRDGWMVVFEERIGNRFDLYRKMDRLLACVTGGKFQFMNELNSVQSDDHGETVFANKADIPLRIVNLILAKYNFMVEETTKKGEP